MFGIHGGDVYRNRIALDFSVNMNPLGIPETVKAAMHEAVEMCDRYPDVETEELRKAVSAMLSVPEEQLLFGNGASELFMAVVHAIAPKKTVIPVPSFYGYEHAAKVAGGEIVYYPLEEETNFSLDEGFFSVLTEDVDLVFLANPNNPTGKRLERDFLQKLFDICKKNEIYLVLDECFIEFCGEKYSMLSQAAAYDHVIIIRAFTKIFAIPGVRLGYLYCCSKDVLGKIRRQLPEWNVSVLAQMAGVACVEEQGFLERTLQVVNEERNFLETGLRAAGIKVFPSDADFVLLYSEEPLYEKLLERGILIRDCENFRGLKKGYYRIAVKSHEEQEKLLQIIGECI